MEPPVVGEPLAGQRRAQDLHTVVQPGGAAGLVDAVAGEVRWVHAPADAAVDPAAAEQVQGRDVLGDPQRVGQRQQDHPGAQP